MALLELLIAGAVLAANAYVKGKSNSSDEEWEEMNTRDKMGSILDATQKDMEKKQSDIEKRVRQNLRGYTDEQLRHAIYHAEKERGRELAREEADRRGISY